MPWRSSSSSASVRRRSRAGRGVECELAVTAEQRPGQRPAPLHLGARAGARAPRTAGPKRRPLRGRAVLGARASVRRGARSGAQASLVTSPAHTRSHSASCSSSGGACQLAQQIGEEARPGAQPRPDQLVLGAAGRAPSRASAADSARRGGADRRSPGAPDHRRVLAEVQRHATGVAPQRARADPHDLAARAQAVQPGRRVGAGAPRQHLALPHLDRQRQPLQRHEHLAQAIDAGAGGRVAVDALPRGQEGGQRALLGRLDLLAQRGQRGAAQAAQDLEVAPLALAASGAQLAAHELAAALELAPAPS